MANVIRHPYDKSSELEEYKLCVRLDFAQSIGDFNRVEFTLCDDESQSLVVDGVADEDIRRYFGKVFELKIVPAGWDK